MNRIEAMMVLARMLANLDRPRGLHKHKCGRCEHVFEHMTPPLEATEEEYHAAHDCPTGCGNNERRLYEP